MCVRILIKPGRAGYSERYYSGSMQKALKNFKLLERFKISSFEKQTADILNKIVSDAILYGVSYYYEYYEGNERKIEYVSRDKIK